jgi:hypothetical protein
MPVAQRLTVIAAALVAALAAAAFVWYNRPFFDVWIELPQVSLPRVEPRRFLVPGADGQAPLLVVIENTPQARPQSGLSEACLVFSVPTEGQITRFLAAFCDATPAVVGPVRSARRYMLEIAGDLGGILVHAGSSAEALDLIVRQRLPVINEFWTPGPFWRDEKRAMPHNLYTGVDRLQAALDKRPVEARPRGVPYAFGRPPETGEPATTIALDYAPPYSVEYRYDASRGWYLRQEDGQPHIDADGKPVAPVSVLVMFVRWWQTREHGIDSSKIDLVGTGRLAIATRGRLIDGAWTRGPGGPLTLRDAAGGSVVLPRGPVWIELFPAGRSFSAH